MKYIVIDERVASYILHEISHLNSAIENCPQHIKNIEWEQKGFKEKISINKLFNYSLEKLNSVRQYINIALLDKHDNS